MPKQKTKAELDQLIARRFQGLVREFEQTRMRDKLSPRAGVPDEVMFRQFILAKLAVLCIFVDELTFAIHDPNVEAGVEKAQS